MAKPGLDGHDRGIKVLAAAYRDAGMDVYLGLRQTPNSIVKVAIQEGVDVIALSILSGAHMTIFTKVIELMKENNLENILVTGGGIIPDNDAKKLSKKENAEDKNKTNDQARAAFFRRALETAHGLNVIDCKDCKIENL